MPRQRRTMGLGMLLLAHKLYTVGLNTLPPITLLAIIGQTLLFLGIINPPWDRYDVCLSGESIVHYKDYRRLFLSAIEHADDFHLYYNMASLMLKGQSLERRYGSGKFFILLLSFTVATSMTYVGLVWGVSEFFETYSYMRQCAIGFSGVLFALKVLTTHHDGNATRYVHGIMVPAKYAVWAELLVIQIIVPRASFIGHLAGILVGLAYVMGPLDQLISAVHGLVSGLSASHEPSYTYTRSTVGSSSQQGSTPEYPRQYYGWNVNDGSQFQREQFSQTSQAPHDDGRFGTSYPQPDAEELRQRRLNRFQY